jgi:cell fate regulator YaaT (PSP1 superfamily)
MNTIDYQRGCATEFRKEFSGCEMCSCNKLNVYNWLKYVPGNTQTPDIVEIRFKNTRKSFFKNVNKLQLKEGDIVAVEASPGHDMGIISLTGELVLEQMRKLGVSPKSELKSVYRKAKPVDIEKWESAIQREEPVMLRARKIAMSLNLSMKIGDVEFQGDGTKAIFYYIADERVDFRQLIKDMADEFKIRIEMRQIGARQEAGRIGGIASCGRTLCCSTWMTDFVSVTTNAARYQEISLNPQKLAGQCGKLKCCLNFEVDSYKDAQKDFPPKVPLQTQEGTFYSFKTDVYRRIIWYSAGENEPSKITAISVERAAMVYEMNRQGVVPQKLDDDSEENTLLEKKTEFQNVVGQESITRFQNNKEDKRKKKNKKQPKTGNDRKIGQEQNTGTEKSTDDKNITEKPKLIKPNINKQSSESQNNNNQNSELQSNMNNSSNSQTNEQTPVERKPILKKNIQKNDNNNNSNDQIQ